MRSFKSVLAMIMAVCLMVCLAVPAFATATEASDVNSYEADLPLAATDETTDAEEITEGTEEPLPTDEEIVEEGTETEEEGSVLYTILLILEVIASVLLILVILLQSGKEAGLSGALSGNSDSYMSKSGKGGLDKKLASATKWIALVWILLTLALSLVH